MVLHSACLAHTPHTARALNSFQVSKSSSLGVKLNWRNPIVPNALSTTSPCHPVAAALALNAAII